MKKPVIATLSLVLAACAGGGGNGGPPAGPVPTAPPLAFPAPSPVGTPIGAPTQTLIGAAGGTLELPGGAVRIDIPAGALPGDQTVGIQELTTTSPGPCA